jgi:hypothetical protein
LRLIACWFVIGNKFKHELQICTCVANLATCGK